MRNRAPRICSAIRTSSISVRQNYILIVRSLPARRTRLARMPFESGTNVPQVLSPPRTGNAHIRKRTVASRAKRRMQSMRNMKNISGHHRLLPRARFAESKTQSVHHRQGTAVRGRSLLPCRHRLFERQREPLDRACRHDLQRAANGLSSKGRFRNVGNCSSQSWQINARRFRPAHMGRLGVLLSRNPTAPLQCV